MTTGTAPPTADLEEIVGGAADGFKALAGSRLLVTGAAGFLGSYICHAVAHADRGILRGSPCRLICVDDLTTGTTGRLGALLDDPNCEVVSASVTDLERLDADVVIHAASIASPPVYRRLPLETVEVNVVGTWRILELARGRARSVLYLSSSEVYGDPESTAIPTPEEYVGRVSFTGPRACYDESKRLAETLCVIFHERHGVPVKIARPFNVYGPTLRLDDGRIIPDLLSQGLRGGPLVLHSDGTPTRSFCYVTDAVRAFFMLLASGFDGDAFNVGTPEEVSMMDVARRIGAALGIGDIRVEPSADPRFLTDNPRRRCPDIRKITARTGWVPRVPLAEGLARTVRHYRGARE